jgi:hypothetical protein
MPNFQIRHNPNLTDAQLDAILARGLGRRYVVEIMKIPFGQSRLVVEKNHAMAVAIRVRQKPGKTVLNMYGVTPSPLSALLLISFGWVPYLIVQHLSTEMIDEVLRFLDLRFPEWKVPQTNRRAQIGKAYLWFAPPAVWGLVTVLANWSEFPVDAAVLLLAGMLLVVLPVALFAFVLSLWYWREWPLPLTTLDNWCWTSRRRVVVSATRTSIPR